MAGARASPLARFVAFALLAVVLPAVIIAVLGYVSLRQWQTSADLLFREQSREMAAMAAEKVRMTLAQAEEEALGRIRAALDRPVSSAAALPEVLAAIPLVRRLYLFDRRGQRLFPWPEGEAPVPAGLVAQLLPPRLAPGGRRYVQVEGDVFLAAVLPGAGGDPVLAVLSRDLDILRRDILARTLGGIQGPSVLAVLDRDERLVYASEPLDRADRIVTVDLGEGLPAWRLALYQPGAPSPRAAVRRQVTLFTATFGLLLLVIIAGLAAAYRLVRRETQMARLKADFVANVSHDLRTPLSLIRMFAETLELGRVRDDARRQEYYRVITRETERLSRLIDNVLDFSRIDRGQQRYDLAPAAVEPLVRDTVEAFGYVLAQQGFDVDVRIAADLPDVTLDAAAIGQALANLIDNAIKYSADRKSLIVEARADAGWLAIAVIDAGIGIPAPEQARIFEKFYRVGRSETQGRRGSGMGLALVRHVAEAHGGRVTVESRPGAGSRFTLWLPLGATGRQVGRPTA